MGAYKFNVFTGKLDLAGGTTVTAQTILDLGVVERQGNYPTGDYGTLTSAVDAFGIATDSAYDCMAPTGQSITVDHGSVA
jgi:hypothetical protein|tara:strand:- start:351 stop:590 length:240 start_codon:yes stop_codon:yes gene_type:complete